MPVLLWIAVLIGIWCAASLVAALALGSYLRHRSQVTDPEGALRPLDTGPLRLWLGDFPDIPDSPAGFPVPAPRPSLDGADEHAGAH